MLPGYRVRIIWDDKGEQTEEVIVQADTREQAEARVREVRGVVDQQVTVLSELTEVERASCKLQPGLVTDGYAEDA